MDNDGISTQITGGVNWEVNRFLSAQAKLTGLLNISVDFETGEMHFVGQVHATGTVKYPGGSPGFDLWAAVDNCTSCSISRELASGGSRSRVERGQVLFR